MCERSASPYHLLLDTGPLNTTKVKMKRLQLITGLGLLIIGLLAQCGLARPNARKDRTRRQAYLPPLAPNGPRIREEYITIHDNASNGQEKLQGTNYGNEKYEIFEIRSLCEPSTGHETTQSNFHAPQYLPPQHEIRVQHIHQTQDANNANIAYQQIASASAATQAVPVPFPSNFKHDFQKTQAAPVQEEVIRVQHIHVTNPQAGAQQIADLPLNSKNQEQYHENQQQIQSRQLKGSDYLPPHHEQHNNQQEGQVLVQQNGPEYVPPYEQETINQPHQLTPQQSIQTSQLSLPDYFPPHQVANAYKGPNYLPPHQVQPNHNIQQQVQRLPSSKRPSVNVSPQEDEHNHEDQLQTNPSSYNAPNYLPPHQEQRSQHNGKLPQSYAPPGYLPPHQEQHSQPHQEYHSQQQVTAQQTYAARDYLPPSQKQQVQPQQNYLSPHQEQHSQQQVQTQQTNTARDYLPPHQKKQVQPQQNYLPPHQEQHGHHQGQLQQSYSAPGYLPPYEEQHSQQQLQKNNTARDYLPPHQEKQVQSQQNYLPPHQEQHGHHQGQLQQSYSAPGYLPPHEEQHSQQQLQAQKTNTARDYLPPPQEQQVQPQQNYLPPQQEQHGHNQGQLQQSNTAPDYLPPHKEQHGPQRVQAQKTNTARDYLPPPQEQPIKPQQNYLPPHQKQHGHHQGQLQQTYTAPNYLSPNQEHHSPQQVPTQQIYTARDYLPPRQEKRVQSQQSYTAPDYLPPRQIQHTHEEIHQDFQLPLSSQERNIAQASASPVSYEPKTPAVQSLTQNPLQQTTFQHSIPQPPSQHLPAALILPPGYDFDKPENAEAAIAELHTLSDENPNLNQQEVNVQTQIQVSQGPQQTDTIYGSQKSEANAYLPPHQTTNNYEFTQSNVQALTSSISSIQPNSQQYQKNFQQNSPQIFAPTQAAAIQTSPSKYLPPTTSVQALPYNLNSHSLSSFMSAVEPPQRYASATRQPFRVYGPPPTTSNIGVSTQQQQEQRYNQIQTPPIAAMYNEQALRAPYYAPAMSYTTNTVANSYTIHHTTAQHHGSNQETRNKLQTFMPTGERVAKYAAPAPPSAPISSPVSASQPAAINSESAVPIRQSSTNKLRTVQILNPTAVKTLKVFETSDHAGVKTIKILGSSNTPPTGEHRIVKVVTQNSPNSLEQIHTLKIFNDHLELPNNGNGYLPPNARVVRQSPSELELVSNQIQHLFTGSHLYRL